MIAVAGPRIDPASLDAPRGVEVRAFVPDLYKHLAASDLAVVQGGLTTTMELAAARRPFLYFPLRDHFEQNRHVRHRLERYGAGRFMDYDASPPEVIAEAIAAEIDRPVAYRPVETDGAARAAALIAPLGCGYPAHNRRETLVAHRGRSDGPRRQLLWIGSSSTAWPWPTRQTWSARAARRPGSGSGGSRPKGMRAWRTGHHARSDHLAACPRPRSTRSSPHGTSTASALTAWRPSPECLARPSATSCAVTACPVCAIRTARPASRSATSVNDLATAPHRRQEAWPHPGRRWAPGPRAGHRHATIPWRRLRLPACRGGRHESGRLRRRVRR